VGRSCQGATIETVPVLLIPVVHYYREQYTAHPYLVRDGNSPGIGSRGAPSVIGRLLV